MRTMKLLIISLVLIGTSKNQFAQTYQWAKSVGSTSFDGSYGMAVDANGNVILGGYFNGTVDFDPGLGTANLSSAGSYDIFLAKYDSSGNYLWAKSIGSTGDDRSYAITVDDNGNVLVTGSFEGTPDFDPGPGTATLSSLGSFDVFFAKFDASGNYLWAKSIGSAAFDRSYGIAVDGNGNVLITGHFQAIADFDPGPGTANLTVAGSLDIFFAKYDPSGNYLWAKSIAGSTGVSYGWSITADGSGNVLITGWFWNTNDFDPGPGTANLTPSGWNDVFFAKYDASGNYLWANAVGSAKDDRGYNIAFDESGNVLLTGEFLDTADFDPGPGTANLVALGNFDIFFAKYDTSGNYLWAKSIGSTAYDAGTKIIPDGSGNVLVTGSFRDTADFDPGLAQANLTSVGGPAIFFAKYDAFGNYIWANSIRSTTGSVSYSIAVDGNGSILLTGWFADTADFDPGPGTANLISAGFTDIFFAKYSQKCNGFGTNTSGISVNCNGSSDGSASISVSGGVGPYTYAWSTGDTTLTVSGLAAGNYMVTATDSAGCTAADTVTITEPQLIQDSAIAIVCENDSVFLQGAYQTTTGIYYDTLTAINGCDSIISTTLTVNPLPTVSFSGLNTSYCSTDAGITMTGMPAGGTFSGTGGVVGDQFFPATGVNTYTVTYSYTDSLGCSNSASQSVSVVQCTGISEVDKTTQIKIYPNPNTGLFNLEINIIQQGIFELKIFNNLGQDIFTEKLEQFKGIYEKRLDFMEYPIGVYNLQLVTDNEVITRHVIIE